MPYSPIFLDEFSGSATSPGTIPGYTQRDNGTAYLKLDGLGNVSLTSADFNCIAIRPITGVAGYTKGRARMRFTWPTGTDSNTMFRLVMRHLPGSTTLGNAFKGYFALMRGNSLQLFINTTLINNSANTMVAGHVYDLYGYWEGDSGTSTLRTDLVDVTDDPDVVVATCGGDDADADMNNQAAIYYAGLGTDGGPYVPSTPSNWKVTELEVDEFIADTAGPTIAAGFVHPSGTAFTLPVSDLYAMPVLPAYGVEGLSFEARADSGEAWADFPTVGPIEISQDTDYSGRITGAFADPLPAGWLIRANYAAGNITDSNSPTPNAAEDQAAIAVTNYSEHDADAVSDKGVMLLATRGHARTLADGTNTNLRACTLHRHEFPYGAEAGWKVVYQGYSDGTADSISLFNAAVWIQQTPDEPRIKVPLTFSGLAAGTIAADALLESDGIDIPVLPSARVWTTQDYRAGLTATGLPYQTYLYIKQSSTGAEDFDGTYTQAYGGSTNKTLTGGFSHLELGAPLAAGLSYVARGYRPMGIVGKPHPGYAGTEVVPIWIGDSLNVQQDDFSPQTGADEEFRGFSGRFCRNLFPYLVFGQSGSGYAGFLALDGTDLFDYIFGDAGDGRKVTHLVDEYGINTIRNDNDASALWTSRLAVAAVAALHDVPYIHTCLTPCGASNLTGAAAVAGIASFIAQRAIFNNKVRRESGTIAGCVGYIDWNEKLETDHLNNTNVAVTGNESGYLHPNSTEHALMAQTVRPALFTGNPNPILSDFPALTVEVTEDGNVLTWPADTSASRYRIDRAAGDEDEAELLTVLDADTLTYTDTDPLNGDNTYFLNPLP